MERRDVVRAFAAMALAGPGSGAHAVRAVRHEAAVMSTARPTVVFQRICAAAFDADSLASMRKRPGMYLCRYPRAGDDGDAWRQRPVDATDYAAHIVHWRVARAFDAGAWHVRVDVSPEGLDVVDAGVEAGDPNRPLVGTLVAGDSWSERFEALYLAAYSSSIRLTVDDAGIHQTRVRPDASVFGTVRLDAEDLAERIRGVRVLSPLAGMTVEIREDTVPSGPQHVATLRFDRPIPLTGADPTGYPIIASRVA